MNLEQSEGLSRALLFNDSERVEIKPPEQKKHLS